MKSLKKEELYNIDAYFRAANYLSVGQLYLLDNPLLKKELSIKDIKPNVVGHWGTAPAQNFIYVHLNRIIKKYDLNMMYISGPGHGGEAMTANNYLDGTYSLFYPNITTDEEGMKKLFKQFSFPKGVSSHVAPETPGSIHEGGELGYSLAHACGAVLDNPSLYVACVIGDGEAETGPLAASWHINKFINPKTDGVVIPILNRNGYKISNPTILGRMNYGELADYFHGLGWEPYFVSGNDPLVMHELMAHTLDKVIKKIKYIKSHNNLVNRWPMIILTTPKGWTGPKKVDGKVIENSFRAHQIPVDIKANSNNVKILEEWMKSYKPEELFDKSGRLVKKLRDLAPDINKTMGSNPNANGGLLIKDLKVPNWQDYTIKLKGHGKIIDQDTMELGNYIRDLIKLNPDNFRFFGPDEALSNRFNHVFEATNRKWNFRTLKNDEFLSTDGRVIDSILSEHVCEGMLEGYILTGRYGFIHSYEAFIRIVDSMASQHAKWLKTSKSVSWRKSIASLNYMLVSHVFQQDHNGYTHQDPGFLNHLVTKKPDTTRIYLPVDTNTLLSTFDHCIKSKDYINVIVASKHPRPQWLNKDEAAVACKEGISIWDFASDKGIPDIVLACAGETPTLEVMAAVSILKHNIKGIKIRVVNIIDLMRLVPDYVHPHGLSDTAYDKIMTKNKPILFNFHGYPSLIHQLTYKRHNQNLHVHGYQEEGTITTTFDIRVQNKIDRFNLVLSALDLLPDIKKKNKDLVSYCNDMLLKHNDYIKEHGKDLDEITNWVWDINKN